MSGSHSFPPRAAAVHAQLAVRRVMLRIALDRHHVDRLRLMRVNVDHEAEIGRQIAAHFVPGIAGVVAAHHVPVLLHEQHVRAATGCIAMRWTQWPTSAFGSGMYSDSQPVVDRLPGLARIVGAERARRRDRDEDPLRIAGIQQNRVQAHAAGARLPARSGAVAAQARQFLPRLARRRSSGTAPRLPLPRRPCPDRSATAPGARPA